MFNVRFHTASADSSRPHSTPNVPQHCFPSIGD